MKSRVWIAASFAALAAQVSPVLAIVSAQSAVLLPHHVQGAGASSTRAGETVTVRGVVTARTSDGFFIQTEVSADDGDSNTSEGLFVSHVVDHTLVGHAVHVTGTVAEAASRTQLQSVSNVSDEGSSTMPPAFELTDAQLSAAGAPDQLERFEGMRLRAALTAVSPTALDGSFFAVLSGVSRTFREPGIEQGSPLLDCASGPCAFETFDGNGERLRVDSDGIDGTAVADVAVEAFMDATGPLDFAAGAYTLLPEVTLLAGGGMPLMEVSGAGDGQYAVASLNLGDPSADADAHQRRMSKASQMVRWVLSLPDVIAVQGAESAAVLGDVATRINLDAPEAGYVALLDGFLVRAARVTVVSVEHVGAATNLFEHPPVMLRALVAAPGQQFPKRLTLINNQFRSLADARRDDQAGQEARAQRQAQAEWLASFIDDRQASNPREAILSLGNYNAHAFNDGYVDVLGTVLGSPAPGNQVVLSSPHLVSPLLNDLTATPAVLRYTSIADGNAQSLDHILATANLLEQFLGVAYARVNADFPESLQFVADDPRRLSDRDPIVAYFSFPGDEEPPVFDALPQDAAAPATGPDGAIVTYALPTATDNADAAVVVSCSPASGSLFALGASVVTCSVQDAAANQATTAFTVTVQDTNAPVLTVPADVNQTATSPSGRLVTFEILALDTVDGPVGASCVPASGSTFPIGTTVVACTTADAAGNGAAASFTVTITDTQSAQGRMYGNGAIADARQRVAFAFDVRESANAVDRGWLVVLSQDSRGRLQLLAANVGDVVFTNAPGYTPGPYPSTGVDTVTFNGVGYWNGRPNHRVEVTASDRGEPGAGRDSFSLVVKSPAGQVVHSSTGVLRSGNVQALRR